MTDQRDDDAFTWAGDDLLQAPARPAQRTAGDGAQDAAPGSAPGGSLGLVALGVFGGIALLEAIGWARSAFSGPLAATLTVGSGSPIEIVAFGADVLGRVAAVVAPAVWVLAVALRVHQPARRIAWLALGAVVLVPWPSVLGIG